MYRTFAVQVSTLERLSPHFVRVTLGSDELVHIGACGPDQRVKVVFPASDGFGSFPAGDDWYQRWRMQPAPTRNPIRTYTVRHADRTARRLVIDFVAHGDTASGAIHAAGPAARWVARAEVGDELLVLAPDAAASGDPGGYEWRPGRARTFLIAGDETATPAVSAIVESLPADAHGAVFLEVPDAADALPLTVPAGMTLAWLPRGGAGHGECLGVAVRSWAGLLRRPAHDGPDGPRASARSWAGLLRRPAHDGPDGPRASARSWATEWLHRPGAGGGGVAVPPEDDLEIIWDVPARPDDAGLYAWLAGEAGAITALRRYLVGELGIDRSRVAFMGYWRLGRAES